MNDAAALHIQTCVAAMRGRGGAMAEAGVFHGASARLICAAKGEAVLHLFDVFETLQSPPNGQPGAAETEVRAHFKTVHGRQAQVEALLAPYAGVRLYPGLFPASAVGLPADARFAFVHLDLDLPLSTEAALAFFHPRLIPGAILIGDDHTDPLVRQVFAAFFAGRADTVIPLPWGQVMVIRQGDPPSA